MTIKGMIDDLLKRGWIVEYLAINTFTNTYDLTIAHTSYKLDDIEVRGTSLKDAVMTAHKQSLNPAKIEQEKQNG